MTESFLFSSLSTEIWIANHEVAHDHRHFDAGFPYPVFADSRMLFIERIVVLTFFAIGLYPLHCPTKFCFRIDFFFDTPHNFAHIDIFVAHAKVFSKEIGVDDRACYTHGYGAYREVALSTHPCSSDTRASEAQNLLCNILWNSLSIRNVLDIPTIDAKSWQAHLRMSCQYRRKIYRSWPIRAVESPHSLDCQRIHVHGLRAIAPTRADCKGNGHSFSGKFLSTSGCFGNASDRSICDYAFNRLTSRMANILRD